MAADRTASVMALTVGLSSFQHCQYSGTSSCTSDTLNEGPVGQVRSGQAVREHAPAKSGPHGGTEPLSGGHEMDRSADLATERLA